MMGSTDNDGLRTWYEILDEHNDCPDLEMYFPDYDGGPPVPESDRLYCREYSDDDESEDPGRVGWDAMSTLLHAPNSDDPADWPSNSVLIANAIRTFYHDTGYKTPAEVNNLMEEYGDRIPVLFYIVVNEYFSCD